MRRKYKWIFSFLGILVFVVCSSYLPDEPLKSKAMAMAFGIDYTDEKLTISLEILTSGSTDTEISTRTVSAQGSTVGECVYAISEQTGLAVTFTHCNVLLLGQSLLTSPHLYAVLNYLITNSYLSDNACVFGCEISPEALLSSKVAFGGNAGLYIREIVGMYDSYGDICSKTLRQYVVDYHRIGRCNAIPYISRVKTSPQIPSSSAETSSVSEDVLFYLNSIAVLVKNTFIGIYPKEDALSLNLLLRKIDKGELTGIGDNQEQIAWFILKNSCDLTYDYDTKTVSAAVKISLLLKDILDYSANDDFVDRTTVTDAEIERSCALLSDHIQSFFRRMQEQNADVFGFQEGFYSRYPRKKSIPLQDIRLSVQITSSLL